MHEADPVQGTLERKTQQIVHVVEARNEEKRIIVDEFLPVRQDLDIPEGRIRTEKANIVEDVSGVGGQVGLQQAISEEIRAGISVVQTQDNVIVQEASSIFQGIHQQIANIIKKQVENGSTLLNHKKAVVTIQEENNNLSGRKNDIRDAIEGLQNFLETLPSKSDVLKRTNATEQALSTIQELSTGLKTDMEHYKVSGSTSHKHRSIQAGQSYTHPDRRVRIEDDSESFGTTQDTRKEADERY